MECQLAKCRVLFSECNCHACWV